MTILATISPGTIHVPSGDSFGPDSVRQKVIDVSAEDTMTNWALSGWTDANAAVIRFNKEWCAGRDGMWQHHRLKWTGNTTLRIFYWNEAKNRRMSINLGRDSAYGASSTGSGDTVNFTAIPLNTWVDVDVEFKKTDGWRVYVNGAQVAVGSYAWPLDCDVIKATFKVDSSLQMTEAVISETDTRGWRVQSEAPASMIGNGFNGDPANLATLKPTADPVSSAGVGSTAKFSYTDLPADLNVVGVNYAMIADVSGAVASPYIAHVLEENGNRHLIGFNLVTSDSEDSPFSSITEQSNLGLGWTIDQINASQLSVEHVHYQSFATEAVEGAYGLITGGPDWDGGASLQLKHDGTARKVYLFDSVDRTKKYGTAERMGLRYWNESSGVSFEGVLTWNGNGYEADLDDTNYNLVVNTGVNLAMTFVAL